MKYFLLSLALVSCGGTLNLPPRYVVPSNGYVFEFSETCEDGVFYTIIVLDDELSKGTMILSGPQNIIHMKVSSQELTENSILLVLESTSDLLSLVKGQALATVDLSEEKAALRWTSWGSFCADDGI